MKKTILFLGLLAGGLIIAFTARYPGCAAEEPLPDLSSRYHTLTDSLSLDSPGAGAEALESFIKIAGHSDLADSAEGKLAAYRGATQGRYREARQLAREGEFDAAEAMLKDLARVDTEDGKSARAHLEFEFYIEQAKWYLVRQRFDESKEVANWLLTQHLNRFQTDEVEKVLDYTGNVGAAMGMVESQNVKNACKQMIVLLASNYVDNGAYPSTFSLADLAQFDSYSAKAIARSLSGIEEYSSSRDHYSMVAVGKNGERYKIADGELQN